MPFLRRKTSPGTAFEPKFAALERVVDAVSNIFFSPPLDETVREPARVRPATPTRTETGVRVAPGDASRFITRLASAVHGYRAVLYAYLAEKEKVLVPTLRAFFTPEEVFAAFAEVLRKTPRAAFGSLVHHLAGGEEAVRAFNARAVVSRSWRFGYGETVKHRSAYRAKVEARLERLLAGGRVVERVEADAEAREDGTYPLAALLPNVRWPEVRRAFFWKVKILV